MVGYQKHLWWQSKGYVIKIWLCIWEFGFTNSHFFIKKLPAKKAKGVFIITLTDSVYLLTSATNFFTRTAKNILLILVSKNSFSRSTCLVFANEATSFSMISERSRPNASSMISFASSMNSRKASPISVLGSDFSRYSLSTLIESPLSTVFIVSRMSGTVLMGNPSSWQRFLSSSKSSQVVSASRDNFLRGSLVSTRLFILTVTLRSLATLPRWPTAEKALRAISNADSTNFFKNIVVSFFVRHYFYLTHTI